MSKAAVVVLLIFFAKRKVAEGVQKTKRSEKCKNSGLTKYNI